MHSWNHNKSFQNKIDTIGHEIFTKYVNFFKEIAEFIVWCGIENAFSLFLWNIIQNMEKSFFWNFPNIKEHNPTSDFGYQKIEQTVR